MLSYTFIILSYIIKNSHLPTKAKLNIWNKMTKPLQPLCNINAELHYPGWKLIPTFVVKYIFYGLDLMLNLCWRISVSRMGLLVSSSTAAPSHPWNDVYVRQKTHLPGIAKGWWKHPSVSVNYPWKPIHLFITEATRVIGSYCYFECTIYLTIYSNSQLYPDLQILKISG